MQNAKLLGSICLHNANFILKCKKKMLLFYSTFEYTDNSNKKRVVEQVFWLNHKSQQRDQCYLHVLWYVVFLMIKTICMHYVK